MTSLVVVAGESTQPLKKFLQDRGSLEVLHSYESLFKNADILGNSMIKADKLVYVYQDATMDIRKDMQVLQRLLTGDVFFNIREIIFFIMESETTAEGLTYFREVMREVEERHVKDRSINLPVYNIRKSEKTLTYDAIYNTLLGMSESSSVQNSFSSVYRVERGNESRKAFEPEDSVKMVVEPFSYKNVTNYKKSQEVVNRTDSGELIIDSADRNVIDKLDIDLGQLDFVDPVQRLSVVVVSGNPKSGVSTFASALAISASAAKKKVFVLDMSKNKGLPFVMKNMNVPFESWDVRQLLTEGSFKQEQSISILHDFHPKLRFHLLRNIIFNTSKLNSDILIIDVGAGDFKDTVEYLKRIKIKSFLLSCTTGNDIDQIQELFKHVRVSDLVLNKHIKMQDSFLDVPPIDIKRMIPNLGRLVAPISFEDFDLDEYLASELLGVV